MIKFKVWDGHEIRQVPNYHIDGFGWVYWQFGFDPPEPQGDENIKVLLYSGKKDKNDIEIYEGDIIQFEWFDESVKGIVKFGEFNIEGRANTHPKIMGFYVEYTLCALSEIGEAMERLTDSLYDIENIERLGTIYEHPFLLKGD